MPNIGKRIAMDRNGELGALLYGYDESQAGEVVSLLEAVTGGRVTAFGGAGRENDLVSAILKGPDGVGFARAGTRLLMLLGFGDDDIEAVLGAFPRDGSFPRPIFCAPTENNLEWTLAYLIEHLLEERECFSSRGKN